MCGMLGIYKRNRLFVTIGHIRGYHEKKEKKIVHIAETSINRTAAAAKLIEAFEYSHNGKCSNPSHDRNKQCQ